MLKLLRTLRKACAAPLRPFMQSKTKPPVVREKLAFILHSPELVNHYASVWNVMPTGSFDVILHEVPLKEIKARLERWDSDCITSDDLIARGIRYRYMVSHHVILRSLIQRLACINIRFMYAAGKAKWNFADWNSYYDLILCYGPYHADKFAKITDAKVIQMGYPRFDRFFNTRPDRDQLCKDFNCAPSKPTIVWLPTWKDLSSVGLFDAEISALTDEYNVVVKVHPLMPESEPERVKALKKHEFSCVLTDQADNMPLYQLADYMLFDYGGPPMAALYTDKKMILLNVPNASSDHLTGEDSPDVELRKHVVNVEAGQNRLRDILKDESVWASQSKVFKPLRDKYFAPYQGTSALRAADILQNLSEHLKTNTSEGKAVKW